MYTQKYGRTYGAKSNTFNGRHYDSKFEATVAEDLDQALIDGEIKAVESQYHVEIGVYRSNGLLAFTVRHKVDFRVTHNDDSFELIEAKGQEGSDYRFRRRLLEEVWLPDNLDHIYTVIKQPPRRMNRMGRR